MFIERPRFPTPEDERRASLLYEVLRALADLDKPTSWHPAPGLEKSSEANSTGGRPRS